MAASGEMEKKIKAIEGDIADVKRQLKAPDLDASERIALQQQLVALQQQLAEDKKRLNRLEEQAAGEGACIRCGVQGRALL